MGAGRRTQSFIINENSPSAANQATSVVSARNLGKSHLGGVIFGCKNSTIKECLFKQLFGLPAQHFSYVKNIDPGLPLFLFNYSDRKLHGIFESASSGQLNINPYAWTMDGSDRTQYPAQVQIRIRLQCQALFENQFKPIITDNYYNQNHFWFELDHAQTSRLLSLLSSLAVAPSSFSPLPSQNTTKWKAIFREVPSPDRREETKFCKPVSLEDDLARSLKSNGNDGSSDDALSLDGNKQLSEAGSDEPVVEKDEKERIYMKLKEIALRRERSDKILAGYVEDTDVQNGLPLEHSGFLQTQTNLEKKNEESLVNSFDYPSLIAQLIEGMEELKAFKSEQIQKTLFLEQKLVAAEVEIRQLKDRCIFLESMSNPSIEHTDETVMESFNELDLDIDEFIYLVGGYDGVSWLSAVDSYSPSHDLIKSLKPMNSIRSYASVAKLNGELYVFGGGNGCLWYDTVESYDVANNQWTLRPSLNAKRGSLAGATVNGKIFAVGGGNGIECFSNVEMFDTDVGRWISTRSMLENRFALGAVELNGVLYAVGGYDGTDYLRSAERFDPREHSWTKIGSMNTKRGCHSLSVLNEKIYAVGGYDGSEMVPSMEIYDPRLGSWITGEPMNQSRGYSAAAVFKEAIYVIGGVKAGVDIVDIVECYEEGKGWEVTSLNAIGKRCFSSAIVF